MTHLEHEAIRIEDLVTRTTASAFHWSFFAARQISEHREGDVVQAVEVMFVGRRECPGRETGPVMRRFEVTVQRGLRLRYSCHFPKVGKKRNLGICERLCVLGSNGVHCGSSHG